MGIEILLLVPAALIPAWIWIAKPISHEAERQLRAEIRDLRARIRLCDAQLLAPEATEETREELRARREDYRRSLLYLLYLETRISV